MSEYETQLWHEELAQLKAKLRYALDNLNDLSKRNDVKGQLEVAYFTLDELCEQTKGN